MCPSSSLIHVSSMLSSDVMDEIYWFQLLRLLSNTIRLASARAFLKGIKFVIVGCFLNKFSALFLHSIACFTCTLHQGSILFSGLVPALGILSAAACTVASVIVSTLRV